MTFCAKYGIIAIMNQIKGGEYMFWEEMSYNKIEVPLSSPFDVEDEEDYDITKYLVKEEES